MILIKVVFKTKIIELQKKLLIFPDSELISLLNFGRFKQEKYNKFWIVYFYLSWPPGDTNVEGIVAADFGISLLPPIGKGF